MRFRRRTPAVDPPAGRTDADPTPDDGRALAVANRRVVHLEMQLATALHRADRSEAAHRLTCLDARELDEARFQLAASRAGQEALHQRLRAVLATLHQLSDHPTEPIAVVAAPDEKER